MQYREGKLGRVFMAKIEHTDDLVESIKHIVLKENVNTAAVIMLGALKGAAMVVGPEEPVVPPKTVWEKFNDGREIAGIGTLVRDEDGQPNLHLHSGVGSSKETFVGCIRGSAEVFMVVEVVILELTGFDALRKFNSDMEAKVLEFLG